MQTPPFMDSRLPESFRLKGVPWQLFATLEFKTQTSIAHFWKMILFAWLRTLAKKQRVHFKKVLFVSRLENGSSGTHWHLHVLVGGLGILPSGFFAFAEDTWKRLNGRFVRVTQFDPRRDGVGYILKAPAGYVSPHRLKDEELIAPTFSDSVKAYLRHRIR